MTDPASVNASHVIASFAMAWLARCAMSVPKKWKGIQAGKGREGIVDVLHFPTGLELLGVIPRLIRNHRSFICNPLLFPICAIILARIDNAVCY